MRYLSLIAAFVLAACSAKITTPQGASEWLEPEVQNLKRTCTESDQLEAGLVNPAKVEPICQCYTTRIVGTYSPIQIANPDEALESSLKEMLKTCAQDSGESISFNALVSTVRLIRELDEDGGYDPRKGVNNVLKKVKPQPKKAEPVPAPKAGDHAGGAPKPAPVASQPARPVVVEEEAPIGIRDASYAKGVKDATHMICSDNAHKYLLYIELNPTVSVSGKSLDVKPVVWFKRGNYNPFNGDTKFTKFSPGSASATEKDGQFHYSLNQQGGGAGALLSLKTANFKRARGEFAAPGDAAKVKLHCEYYDGKVSNQQLLQEKYTFEKEEEAVDPNVKTYTDPNSGIGVQIQIRRR